MKAEIRLALRLLVMLGLFCGCSARVSGEQMPEPAVAQASAQQTEPPAGQEPSSSLPEARQQESSRERLAETSNRTAREESDEQAAFKYSASVKWIARTTGISVATAYWVLIGINFVLIVAVVVWIWKSQVPQAFRERSAAIRKEMEEARRASEEANRRLSEVESRLARLDSQISELRAEAEAEAAREEARIHAAAEEDRRKIVEAAEQEIEAMARQARRELKAYAAELAVSLAEKRIQVDPAEDRLIVGHFVEHLTNGIRRK